MKALCISIAFLTLMVGIVGCSTPSITAPIYSKSEAISTVWDWLFNQAETPAAKEIVRSETTNLQASYQGEGIWEVRGNGRWNLYEVSGTVKPIDDNARNILEAITNANQPAPVITEITTPVSLPTIASAVSKVKPAVVRIITEYGMGSGMVIDKAGYVLTNSHVVEGSQTATVILTDGQDLSASILGRDEIADLAILQISGTNLPFVTLGDSDKLEGTEEVIAIGYPLDLEGSATVSSGIVSALRNYGGVDYIQTDTAINPGNSGGPLINLDGEVIGINVLTIRVVGGLPIEGMNFAIAINSAKPIIPRLIAGESILASGSSDSTPPTPNIEPFDIRNWKVRDRFNMPYLQIEFSPIGDVYLSLKNPDGLELKPSVHVLEGITGAELRLSQGPGITPQPGTYSVLVRDSYGELITSVPVANFLGANIHVTDSYYTWEGTTINLRIDLANTGDLPAYITEIDVWAGAEHPNIYGTKWVVVFPREATSVGGYWYEGIDPGFDLSIEVELKDKVGNVITTSTTNISSSSSTNLVPTNDVPSFSESEVIEIVSSNHLSDIMSEDIIVHWTSHWEAEYLGNGTWEVRAVYWNAVGIWEFYETNQTVYFKGRFNP